MFFNDRTSSLIVDEEFQKLWRSVAVESMDDQKIEEYLEKQVALYVVILINNKYNQNCRTSKTRTSFLLTGSPLFMNIQLKNFRSYEQSHRSHVSRVSILCGVICSF